jgi:hypothetical protein
MINLQSAHQPKLVDHFVLDGPADAADGGAGLTIAFEAVRECGDAPAAMDVARYLIDSLSCLSGLL